MSLVLEILEQSNMKEIHDHALAILESVGMRFNSRKACQALEDIGASVDWNQLSVKIPRDQVELSISSAPIDFTLSAANPDRDIYTGDSRPWYTSGGQRSWIRDLETGQRRQSTLADLRDCVRLVDRMDSIDEWCPMVVPHDLPAEIAQLASLDVSLRYSRKHFLTSSPSLAALPFFKDLLDAYLGDVNRLKSRPLFTLTLTPAGALQIDGDELDQVLSWADYQIPVIMDFLPMAGRSSPISLAGTMVQETASFLGLVTLFQTVSSGWPIIWGADAGVVDQRSGYPTRICPETVLMEMGFVQMAKELYEVPSSVYGYGTEAHEIGFVSGLEAALTTPLTELAGADNIRGVAELEGRSLIDLDYMVLADEITHWMDRIRDGISFTERSFQSDLIEKMGFDTDFFAQRPDPGLFNKEYQPSDLFPGMAYEDWEKKGLREHQIARQRVHDLIDSYEPVDHSPEVLAAADSIIARATQELAG